MNDWQQRAAEPGELCTCGRPAAVVYATDLFGETGYCGIGDGGATDGPCPFCGGPRHPDGGRCPSYRLRLYPDPEPWPPSPPQEDGDYDPWAYEQDAYDVNPACGHHIDSRCDCGVCLVCDGCYCEED